MEMLSISGVAKAFGSHRVIKNLSFTVPEHTIYGFIGKNGSGKTTTMNMILGLLRTDAGEIRVNGEPVTYGQNRTNRYIGYLPDVPEFYGYMTPMEYLALCGEITGMKKEEIRQKSSRLLELAGLEHTEKRIQGFSRGMKQRLGIAQALLNSPRLLICDEPTSALDPIGRKEILDILARVREETTVIFSTHILSDVERICDEIGLLNDGTLRLSGTLEEIQKKHSGDGFEIEFVKPEDAQTFAGLMDGSERTGRTRLIYAGRSREDMGIAMGILAGNHLCPQRIEMREPTLEKLFMEVVGQ